MAFASLIQNYPKRKSNVYKNKRKKTALLWATLKNKATHSIPTIKRL